ncbi:pentatricopeptide repeat-containing protein At4g02750 [Cryptomeria japonica]|uniref:pentatricopeptide repeat-containing protein At4g02750 n=1 Tax=Cryptomeria japonica TaxID=3369 RepID=UPI0027DA323D|nr:pentatricopeptide repeat-containing protein At4g02750 [Cryptomeria japonica]
MATTLFRYQIINKNQKPQFSPLYNKYILTTTAFSGNSNANSFDSWESIETYISRMLTASGNTKCVSTGQRVHTHMIKHGFDSHEYLSTGLEIMYVKNQKLMDARKVFDKMPERNVVSWTGMITGYALNGRMDNACQLFDEMPERNSVTWSAMIAGYAQNGQRKEALKFFWKMRKENVEPRQWTFVTIASVCGEIGDVEQGRQVHNYIIKTGFLSCVAIENALITMYAKCGSVENAHDVFDRMPERNVVSWTAMIAGFNQNGRVEDACKLFDKMPQRNVVSWNAMISGFARNGKLEEARRLFSQMPNPNAATWNAIIAGYAQHGYGEEALDLFSRLQQEGNIKQDCYTFSSVLQACATAAAIEKGKQIHSHVIRLGFESDLYVGGALVNMYAKSGSIMDAHRFFEKMPQQNAVSWNVMIVGFAQNGHGSEALRLFELMQHAGIKPDAITFVGVLVACSHTGLVDKGKLYFDCMILEHDIIPGVDHYACMVDLLGRAGFLDEAECFINNMPIEPDAVIWRALLGACRIHSNLKLSIRVAERLLDLEPECASTYVLLANSYAAAGRWDDVRLVRIMMRDRGIKKDPGCSWIEFQNKVHRFVVDDSSHPQTHAIYKLLEALTEKIKEEGYVPETNFVLHDIEGEQKEHMLCYHSEKLAIAFGISNIPPGATIRVIKNLRMCGDCHTATKFISKTVGREIVVRDASRFHHFMNGFCSCKDYW